MRTLRVIACLLLFGLISCSNIVLYNEEGFRFFRYGAFITETNACIQSHEGFVINDVFFTEYIGDKPISVKNVLNHDISVKITDLGKSYWESISANNVLIIE